MTSPHISGVELGGDPSLPLLVVGPSLGTSVHALWGEAATELSGTFHVVGWDLPGHGHGPPASEAFTMTHLAAGLLALVDEVLEVRGEPAGSFAYAGVSAAGAVGLQVLLDHPGRISAATLLCTGARIGTPASWAERAALVRESGTAAVVEGSAQRWFAPGFIERRPETRPSSGPSRSPTRPAMPGHVRRWAPSTRETASTRSPPRSSPSQVPPMWPLLCSPSTILQRESDEDGSWCSARSDTSLRRKPPTRWRVW